MDVTITQVNPTSIKAEVTLDWEAVAGPFQDSVKDLQKSAQLPGFRKGRVPVGFLKRRFRQILTDELARKVVPDNVASWVKEKEVKAVGQPQLDHIGFHENESFHYAVFLDVLPEFELKPWQGLAVESLNVQITADTVDKEIEGKLVAATKHEVITERAAEPGDTLTMALTVIDKDDGEELTEMEDYSLVIGSEESHPQLDELVTGLATGDDASLDFLAADDVPFESWRGKQVTAYVEIIKIERVEKPALDDAFAKEQGAEDLASFREQVEKELIEKLQEVEMAQTRSRLITSMMDAYDFQVPQAMIAEEAKHSVEKQIMPYAQHLGQKGLDQKFLQMLMQAAWPQATLKVRSDLVLDKIAEDLAIEIEESELDQELEQILDILEADSVESFKADENRIGLLENVKTLVRRRKTVDAIYAKAEVSKVDQLTEKAEDQPAEETVNGDQPATVIEAEASTPVADSAVVEKEIEEDTTPAG